MARSQVRRDHLISHLLAALSEHAVPTAAAFATAKTAAWLDRATSRDLFDLWLLSQSGAITEEAAQLFTKYGPTNKSPGSTMFSRAPDEDTWRRNLSGQTRPTITAEQALIVVGDAWRRLRA